MGKSSSASCVEVITLPLGLRIVMGVTVVRWLMTGVVMVAKWAVLPVLAIAMFGGGGGVAAQPLLCRLLDLELGEELSHSSTVQ
jgi:hypothetical protein